MRNIAIPIKSEIENPTDSENKRLLDNHNKTAIHLEAASKYHIEASKHHKAGDHRKAAQVTIVAQWQLRLASEALIEEVHYIAFNNRVLVNHQF